MCLNCAYACLMHEYTNKITSTIQHSTHACYNFEVSGPPCRLSRLIAIAVLMVAMAPKATGFQDQAAMLTPVQAVIQVPSAALQAMAAAGARELATTVPAMSPAVV